MEICSSLIILIQSYLCEKYIYLCKYIYLIISGCIRCNPMHPLNDVLPGQYVPVRVTRGVLVAHRFSSASSLRNLAVREDFCSPLSVPQEWSCWPRVRWCVTGEFLEQGQWFFISQSCSIHTILSHYFSISLLPVYRLVLWAGVIGQIGCISLSLSLALPTSFNNNNNNNNNNNVQTKFLVVVCVESLLSWPVFTVIWVTFGYR